MVICFLCPYMVICFLCPYMVICFLCPYGVSASYSDKFGYFPVLSDLGAFFDPPLSPVSVYPAKKRSRSSDQQTPADSLPIFPEMSEQSPVARSHYHPYNSSVYSDTQSPVTCASGMQMTSSSYKNSQLTLIQEQGGPQLGLSYNHSQILPTHNSLCNNNQILNRKYSRQQSSPPSYHSQHNVPYSSIAESSLPIYNSSPLQSAQQLPVQLSCIQSGDFSTVTCSQSNDFLGSQSEDFTCSQSNDFICSQSDDFSALDFVQDMNFSAASSSQSAMLSSAKPLLSSSIPMTEHTSLSGSSIPYMNGLPVSTVYPTQQTQKERTRLQPHLSNHLHSETNVFKKPEVSCFAFFYL